MSVRKRAVKEGRALISVRNGASGRMGTVGVCPGCWSLPTVRPALLAKLAARGLVVAHGDDGATGRFPAGSPHAPGCPRALRGE